MPRDELQTRIDCPHYLQRQAIRPSGALLANRDRLTWDDVALEPGIRERLLENIVSVLSLRGAFQHNGLPQRRGILLHGVPGNGKTMIGKVLAGLGNATFVWVTALDAERAWEVRHAFVLARRLRPSILFLEDLDLYASDRGEFSDRAVLGEILAQMDGLEENDGVITIATTNDLAAVEPALSERPSRFDVALEIGPPAEEARRRILERHLGAASPVQRHPDGSVSLLFQVNGLSEIVWWVLGWCGSAQVVRPPELRKVVVEQLHAALKLNAGGRGQFPPDP